MTPITATLTDSDGEIDRIRWTWERDNDAVDDVDNTAEGEEVIDDANSATKYTPIARDNGMYLRAKASIHGSDHGGRGCHWRRRSRRVV